MLKSGAKNPILNIVYFGPALAGKTTNLLHIHTNLAPEVKSEIVSQLINENDRLLCFDLRMPEQGTNGGKPLKFHVKWFGGAIYYWERSHRYLLKEADAIVLVVDSLRLRLDANLETLAMLNKLLNEQRRPLEDIPWVIQYNKRDLPDILPVEELQRQLNRHGVPAFETIATQGRGVVETLQAVLRLAVTQAGNIS
jgi:mutual gliding-motility protein MglA